MTNCGLLEMYLFNRVEEGDTRFIRIVDKFLPDNTSSDTIFFTPSVIELRLKTFHVTRKENGLNS